MSASPTIGVLALQGDVREHLAALRGSGAEAVPVRRTSELDAVDALVLPGGTLNSDKIRTNQQAIDFVKAFFDQNKPVASICHGPWILIEAGVVPGRTLTSTARISTDLKNAGATWVDQEVVVDGNLITSRSPRDLDAFNAAIVEKFAG